MTNNARDHINKIRHDKFGLDENGHLKGVNPLASDLQDSIEHLAEGLYSSNAHFIFELIQNAEDNTYGKPQPSLSLRLLKADPTRTDNTSGALVFQNNEVGFFPENINAICAVGKTTKSKVHGYIGEKGIGFKSVFQVTSNPHIFSNGYSFCLPEKDEETGLGYIVPKWIEQALEGIDPSKTTIVLPLDKVKFSYEIIEKMLRDIEPETILFLSKIKELTVSTDTGDNVTIIKDDSKSPLIQVIVNGIKAGTSISNVYEFLVYTKTFSVPENIYHEKRIGIADREVTIAFPHNDENSDMAGKLFAYLPINSNISLPLLINSDFTLTSSREAIQEEQPWNQWLAKCVAELIGESIGGLKKYDYLTVNFLEKLSAGIFSLDEKALFYPVVGALHDVLMKEELLPTDDSRYASAKQSLLAGADDLHSLLDREQLTVLLSSKDHLSWLASGITERKTPQLWRYLKDMLEISEIDSDRLASLLSEEFLQQQRDEWFIRFYEFLLSREALWRAPRFTNEAGGILRRKPIVRLENGFLIAPFDMRGQANVYLPPEHSVLFPVVCKQIAKHQVALNFLQRLGLELPDEVADVIENILPKYRNEDISPSSEMEYCSDLQAIFNALKTDSQRKKDRLLLATRETPFVKASNVVTGEVAFRKPGDIYLPTDVIQVYLAGNPNGWVLCRCSTTKCVDDEGEQFWAKLEIASLPRRVKHEKYPSSYRLHNSTGSETIANYDLDGLESFFNRFQLTTDFSEKVEMSKVLWRILTESLVEYREFFLGRHNYSTRKSNYYETFNADFTQTLLRHEWLPTDEGLFKRPSETRRDEIHSDLEQHDELCTALSLKPSLTDLQDNEEKNRQQHVAALGLDETDLENIKILKEHPKAFEQWKAGIAARKERSIFPKRTVENPERRAEQLAELLKNGLEKKFELRTLSTRVTVATEFTRIWLKEQYTHETTNQMFCQICKEEMPFRKRDGKYYFEAVEALSKTFFPNEHEAQHLALCPLCAAMYKEFVKLDENAMKDLSHALKNSKSDEFNVSLKLGELETSIQFVESHWLDIKTILQERG